MGNHIRLSLRQWWSYTGDIEAIPEDETQGKAIAIYCRASSYSQKTSLDKQATLLTEYVAKTFPGEEMRSYKEIASSCKKRDSLNRLVADCVSGKVSKVVLKDESRISRWESELEVLKSLLTHLGISLVVV